MAKFLCLLFVIGTFPVLSRTACHGSKTSYRAEFTGKLALDNQVLAGHVFATFTVKRFNECFEHCDEDCRCRSFNLPMTGEGECQLNSVDNTTALIKPLRGWRYHHLKVKEVLQGDATCYEPYSNGCCDNNPCVNAASCTETGDRGKPGFVCQCQNEYHTGPFCERLITSCADYLWNDRTATSGYYDIWKKNSLTKIRVYCDMQPEEFEAWTLVMSLGRDVAYNNRGRPLYYNYPLEEVNADSLDYRLSLDKMNNIRDGLEDCLNPEWKVTCEYSFTSKQTTNEDILRSAFSTLDILTYITYSCHRVDYISIRGNKCYNCDVYAYQSSSQAFTINAQVTDSNCNYNSGSRISYERIFGNYHHYDVHTHKCASKSTATTQYWFGGRLIQ